MVLRFAGPEVYDQWVAHEIPFDDPADRRRGPAVRASWRSPRVLCCGGRRHGWSPSSFGDAPDRSVRPTRRAAMLHRQGNFITGFFPEDDVTENLDENVGVVPTSPPPGRWGRVRRSTRCSCRWRPGGMLIEDSENAAADEFMEFLANPRRHRRSPGPLLVDGCPRTRPSMRQHLP